MPKNRSLDAIIAGLGAILIAAPERERQRLARAIEAYAIRAPTAFRDLQRPSNRGHAAAFREVIDAVDAQPE